MIFPNTELKEYSKLLSNTSTIHVCIVGQDIYPKNHSGIAFNKNTFDRDSLKEEAVQRVKEVWRNLNLDVDD